MGGADPGGETLEQTRKRVFGHDDWRPGQAEVIRSVLSGRSTLAVMPTGAGKSLCYQLPAAILGGTTLVVSPLIALIRDQVRALEGLGLRAAAVTSLESASERRATMDALAAGQLDLCFVAPERFRSRQFLEAIAPVPLSLFVVDEAHCIAQWGHDFRPDYARLGEILTTFKPPRIVALTATATPEVRDQIVASLGLTDAEVIVTGFDRPQLELSVIETARGRQKLDAIRRTLAARMGEDGSAIVYAATRKKSETLANVLSGLGFDAHAYHAGLPGERRATVERNFASGKRQVVVATTAFGMGIDKADVRVVVHAQIPSSPEAYYQEVGRAGRDGERAAGVLFYDSADLRLSYARFEASCPTFAAVEAALEVAREIATYDDADFLGLVERVENRVGASGRAAVVALEQAGDVSFEGGQLSVRSGPSTVAPELLEGRAKRERQRLDAMIGYVTRAPCRRRYLVDYFGDTRRPEHCGLCDRCRRPPARALSGSSRRDALIALSCVARMRGRYGKLRAADVLIGSRAKPILEAKLDVLSTYGLLSSWSRDEVLELIDATIRAELTRVVPGDYPKLLLTERGAAVLKSSDSEIVLDLELERWSPSTAATAAGRAPTPPAAPLGPEDSAFFERLRAWRFQEAQKLGVPPYVVAHDKLLRAIAVVRPASPQVLAALPGVGPTKLARFGDAILTLVAGAPPREQPFSETAEPASLQ